MDSIEYFKPDGATHPTAKPNDHQQIATLAYEYWMQRGCPEASPEIDWLRAEEHLRNQARLAATAEALIAKTLTR
jgi:hypothetical protein